MMDESQCKAYRDDHNCFSCPEFDIQAWENSGKVRCKEGKEIFLMIECDECSEWIKAEYDHECDKKLMSANGIEKE